MAWSFGRYSGPVQQPRPVNFGRPPSPSQSPPFPHTTPPRSPIPRDPVVVERARSPPLVYDSLIYETSGPAERFGGMPRRPGTREIVRSPPSTFESTAGRPSYPSLGGQRPTVPPPQWVNGPRSFYNTDERTSIRPSAATSFVASGNSATAKIFRGQDLKRSRSPPSYAQDEDISRNSSRNFLQSRSDSFMDNHSARTNFNPPHLENDGSTEHLYPPYGEGQLPASSSSARDTQQHFQNSHPNPLVPQQRSSVLPYTGPYNTTRGFLNEVTEVPVPKRSRSPSTPATNAVFQKESKRPSASPPRLGDRSNGLSTTSDTQIPRRTSPSTNNTSLEVSPKRTVNYSVAKRTRSPPLATTEEVFQGNSTIEDDTEREMQAKARRLARFKNELSESVENRPDVAEQKTCRSRLEDYSMTERQHFVGRHSTDSSAAGDFNDGKISSDFEGPETSIIIGLCPDMCPESERGERERKGDLDQYERLDGDRNQTNKYLAIKKYTRTAEREASLIRPLPVLQKTIDYLLKLLDQPYDDQFLGIYNFLWDRMRAIRMDLRMQHIFNREAITMLEKMIRLHIIAMHELCEYTKGEGFSEGFDAHLNIEQMNKASVELFQLYDDHRKRGISVPTEKEFRGYYALLKLDKHPGYKVEPAELSLDLAKMSPEIRQTPDVLFARAVARACRTGNFVAFFRLARKASYLQACLIHAHFAKLRTQALASLYSGLQNNQGLPVSHVAKWLAMEDEDIETLLDYHGFAIKEFEEPYMVKEGPFLNGDQDYATKRSLLVELKKSEKIVDDVVSATSQVLSLPAPVTKRVQLPTIHKQDKNIVPSTSSDSKISIHKTDEDMAVAEVLSPPKSVVKEQPITERSRIRQQNQDNNHVESPFLSPWRFTMAQASPVLSPPKLSDAPKPNNGFLFNISAEKKVSSAMEVIIPPQEVPRTFLRERSPSPKYNGSEKTIPQIVISNDSKGEEHPNINQETEEEEEVMKDYENEVVAQAKLKLIIRLWRRRSSRLRELREQRQIIANAALSSMSLGPPIQKAKDHLSSASDFDIERVLRKRQEKQRKYWSKLNVSDVIAGILGKRNPGARCLCWKIVLCSQMNQERDMLGPRNKVMHVGACSWLLSKISPFEKDDDLIISSSGVSIWKKWVPSQSGNDLTCCLSVIRIVNFDDLNGKLDGASAILFLVSEIVPMKVQKLQLQNLLMSIPSGSCLPLLVLCSSYNKEVSDISSSLVSELGLREIDKSRVSGYSVVFLIGDQEKENSDAFFSDERLKEGLRWLANESPPQPDVHCVKTRDLILSKLNPSLDLLEKESYHEVGPNHCISTFNEALDRSVGEISAAAKSNPIGWPCSEVTLLPDTCDEHMVVRWYLPTIGWSSAARIEPLVSAVKKCKLPTFPKAISWSDMGAKSADEIENLRLQLENCLINYMTQANGMVVYNLAIKEAQVMLQKSAWLELRDSTYYIVPKWISVFRRIFNWQLTSLSNPEFSSTYVLRQHHIDPTYKFELEDNLSLPYLSRPSLDEIIVGCAPVIHSIRDQPKVEAFQPPTRVESNGDGDGEASTNMGTSMEDERRGVQLVMKNGGDNGTGEFKTPDPVGRTAKEADKLTKLLEQCNLVQKSIDEKLYLYF